MIDARAPPDAARRRRRHRRRAPPALLRRLAEKASLPVAATLLGLGAMPHDHPLFLGMVGMHAARYTNLVLEECDLLIAARRALRRPRHRQGGGVLSAARRSSTSTSTPASSARSSSRRSASSPTSARCCARWCRACAADAAPRVDRAASPRCAPRIRWRCPAPTIRASPTASSATPPRSLGADAIVTTDVGQHQMWVAQAYPFTPAAAVAHLGRARHDGLRPAGGDRRGAGACPDRTVVCFSGDGSLLMNLQELATAAEENVNVKIVLLNNAPPRPGAPAAAALLRRPLSRVALPRRARLRRDRARLRRRRPTTSATAATRSATLGARAARRRARVSSTCRSRAEENVYPMVPPGARQPRHDRRRAMSCRLTDASTAPCVASSACSVRNHPGVMSHVCGLFARRGLQRRGHPLPADRRRQRAASILLLVNDDERLEQMMRQLAQAGGRARDRPAPEARAAFAAVAAVLE